VKLSDLKPEDYKLEQPEALSLSSISDYQVESPAIQKEAPSAFESGIRGAAQGASFGFADEIQAALQSAVTPEDYETVVARIRDQYKSAEAANPGTYFTGNIAGGLVIPGLGTAGLVGKGAKLGKQLATAVGSGALTSVGVSESSDAKELVKEGIIGAGIGLGTAGLVGGVSKLAQSVKGAGQALGKTDTAENIADAYRAGKAGINLTTREGVEAVEAASKTERDFAAKALEEQRQLAGKELGKAIKESGESFDIGEMEQLRSFIEKNKTSPFKQLRDDALALESQFLDITQGIEKNVPVKYKVVKAGKQKLVPGEESSFDKLRKEAQKLQEKARLLNEDVTTEIVPSKEPGLNLLSLLKTTGKEGAEDAKVVRTLEDLPGRADEIITEPTTIENVEKVLTSRTGGKTSGYTAEELKNLQAGFNVLGGTGTAPTLATQEGVNVAKLTAKSLGDKLTKDKTISAATGKYRTVKQAMNELGIGPEDFERLEATGEEELVKKVRDKLSTQFRQIGDLDSVAAKKAKESFDTALTSIKQINPELAEKIRKGITETSRLEYLARVAGKTNLPNKATYLKSGTVTAGNIVGRQVKRISDATPEFITQLGDKLSTSGTSEAATKVGGIIKGMAAKDATARKAIMFAMMQNPEYRKVMEEFLPDNEQE
jgi:hypothetical protein